MLPKTNEPLAMNKRKIADKIYTFVCDDIRHEMGNKVSLMGMYDDIVVNKTPTILPKINLALLIKGLRQKINTINVGLKRPDGEIIGIPEIRIAPNAKLGSNHNIDLCIAPLKIEAPGKFVWEIRIDGEDQPSITQDMVIQTIEKQQPSKSK